MISLAQPRVHQMFVRAAARIVSIFPAVISHLKIAGRIKSLPHWLKRRSQEYAIALLKVLFFPSQFREYGVYDIFRNGIPVDDVSHDVEWNID
jgi:hypothetical protein